MPRNLTIGPDLWAICIALGHMQRALDANPHPAILVGICELQIQLLACLSAREAGAR